jgi:hypothetical protein
MIRNQEHKRIALDQGGPLLSQRGRRGAGCLAGPLRSPCLEELFGVDALLQLIPLRWSVRLRLPTDGASAAYGLLSA